MFNKRLGSDYKNSLSLHHSAREAGLLRKREPMKKEGFKRVRQDLKSRPVYFKHGNRKKEKEKKLQKVFGSSEKISTFAVPTETEGKTKKIKRGAMPIGI
ncbi:hypothetical protein [Sphingobacterium sp. HMA12]|uniref:hypothetical protein n=1 Tax=Sphingobacterium sp. HMA12 TaxID=2050894 RepID=UPI000CE9C42F|nr:hypothetical protein [Sphingobacterium sp. HMA12]